MKKKVLNIGLIGLGRSGRDIHGRVLEQLTDHYRIAAVSDSIAERRQRAESEYGCRAYATWEEMVGSEKLDLIVNASPSHQHFPITLALLESGHHVLCEKPLARSTEEVDRLIEASNRTGSQLAVFQQARYQPAFEQIRKVIDSGVLGRIVQIDFRLNGFARRWDWQTLQSNNGGSLMNTGPHPIDQALQLFGTEEMPSITCIMDLTNTFGDAEDYVKLIMRGPGKATIDIEISSCCAFPGQRFHIQGTNGGLQGDGERLEWKYFEPEKAPEQKLIREPLFTNDGMPAYCSEKLPWHSGHWDSSIPEGKTEFDHMTERLYLKLYDTLTEGAEPEITPWQIRRQMQVMEECRRQNRHIYASLD
ncbi:gfo/Idh/MocA family oxidoreductase [Paenibacillaceae bacterium]|nr:gfo/Idh/MocA family oxidoreductase [Paenibacillaceae bacterium]